MKKINNKGFALVETLIVTAFVVGIFSVMYANFYPMMGEYEKRENYDDISSIYNTNLFKNLIEKYKNKEGTMLKKYINKVKNYNKTSNCRYEYNSNSYQPRPVYSEICDNEELVQLNSDLFKENQNSTDGSNYYDTLVNNLNVDKIYLLPYKITTIKLKIKTGDINDIDTQTREYIDYLPDFSNNPHNLECRIIVKFKAGENRESNENNSDECKFATIGVDC